MRIIALLILLPIISLGQDTAGYEYVHTWHHLNKINALIKPGKDYPIRQYCAPDKDPVITGKVIFPEYLITDGNIKGSIIYYIQKDTCIGLSLTVKDSSAQDLDSLLYRILPKPRHTITKCNQTVYVWDWEKYSNGFVFREYHCLSNGGRYYTTWYKQQLE